MTVAGMLAYFTIRLAAERNAALAEASRTQRIQGFMLNLFEGGDKEAGPATDLRVTTLIERGVQEARTLDQDPAVQAELYQTLGEVYQKLGSLDQADALLSSALERRRSLGGDTVAAGLSSSPDSKSADVAGALIALGLLRVDQAKLPEAERLVREGLQKIQQSLPAGHPSLAAATDALGRVLAEKGEYSKAIPVLQEAVRLRSAPNASQADLGASLYELANVYFYAGKYKESEALNQRVLAINQAVYGERHPKVAEALVNLGAIQHESGNYAEAAKFHREALRITESFYGERHYRTASNLTLLARALVYQKQFEEATGLLDRAVGIQESVFGGMHPRVASAVNELGNVAVMRGQLDVAKAAFRRMAQIYRAVYPGGHYLIGTAISNLGSAHLAENDTLHAEPLFREAIAIYSRTLGPDHLNTAIARIKLGRALLRQKRNSEAESEVFGGYQILNKQVNPSVSWLKTARTDLAAVYDALHQPDKAASFRREIAQLQTDKQK
ncbi:MAG: tetratricopeptide repeat protein [Bryobacteraceae bacterium]|nr:tetratricopeptide repeat protein [Bryobacteraceae bacterium]